MQVVRVSGGSEFEIRLKRVIQRVESWSYADSDAGAGGPEEVAEDIAWLVGDAATPELRRRLRRAQDALDDGLSAEAVAAALYQVRTEFERSRAQGSRPPSPSR